LWVEWSHDRAEPWVEQHKGFYERAVLRLLSGEPSEYLLRRLARPEFRLLDKAVFDALTAIDRPIKLSEKKATPLSHLMVPLARIAKGDPDRRRRWRRLLAELEKSGERLAWQILTEVADRV
jgi:hypothetical protein